ncbi:SDR family oxidoreductase [Streptomyces sp. DSM 41921]|uniref:SDR family oxidoreductase n=1 Tax=Streptomyces dubilierae TaxID=3075533 RepID=A0ABU2PIT1_9ACTN|nr:SDR family oxidoreductase [Streptomyces sp. DSM 41921]MDT0392066.1 SDR family oxidoreductase [Streptomyces sp. DSM 41921]
MTAERPLKGKVAFVAGASSGIGASIARTLASAGASVALVARRKEHLASVERDVAAYEVPVLALPADLAAKDAPQDAVNAAEQALGPVDILVNNAALARTGPIHDTHPRHWRQAFHLNLDVPFLLIRAVLPGMRERGHGWIVNISSEGSLLQADWSAPYSITKRALNALTAQVDIENRHVGVRAVAVLPGWVRTDLAQDPETLGVGVEDLLDPSDIADVVLWAVTRPAAVGIGPLIPVRPVSRNAQTLANWEHYLRTLRHYDTVGGHMTDVPGLPE